MKSKLGKNESSFKQLEYFSMANWKKLETLRIDTKEKDVDFRSMKNAFDFPLLKKL